MPLTHEWPAVGSREYTSETQAVIDEIAEDIDSLDENVTTLQVTTSGLSSSVATIETDIDQIQDDLLGIPTDVEEVANMRAGIFNVLDYGASGNGVTDDRAAIQLAADALYYAGGGTLYFPGPYTYKIGYRAGFYGASCKVGILLYGSNIRITTAPDAFILFDEGHVNDCQGFCHVNAAGITPENVDSSGSFWLDHAYLWPSLGGVDGSGLYPTYEMVAASKGQDYVELATPAELANFSVGDAVVIRSGQTIDSAGEAQPDGELNEVAWISSPNLGLKHTLAKDYVQEYFPDSGRDNASTTASTSYPALFGVQNITGCEIRNVHADHCNIIVDNAPSTGTVRVFNWSSAFDTSITNCNFKLRNGTMGNIAVYRGYRFDNNRVEMTLNNQADAWVGGDRCCGDFSMSNNFLTAPGDYVGLFHIHEGCFQGKIRDNIIINNPSASDNSAIQVLGRGYDIEISGNYIEFDSSATGAPILIGGDVYGLILANNQLKGSRSVIGATNTQVSGNEGLFGISGSQVHTDVRVLSHWIYDDSDATVILGSIPAHCYVLNCEVLVFEAFNGTSPTLSVGADGAYGLWFMDSVSLSSQARLSTRTHPDVQFYQQGGVDSRDAAIVYTSGGSTTGKALVVLQYAWVQQGDGV